MIKVLLIFIIDTAASHGMRDGQSLLDEMSRPIKNAFGKDISPDYAHQIKHITQKLEELQERKMRCDDLAEVRKLKLQQTLQLRTCERDVDQVSFCHTLFYHMTCHVLKLIDHHFITPKILFQSNSNVVR